VELNAVINCLNNSKEFKIVSQKSIQPPRFSMTLMWSFYWRREWNHFITRGSQNDCKLLQAHVIYYWKQTTSEDIFATKMNFCGKIGAVSFNQSKLFAKTPFGSTFAVKTLWFFANTQKKKCLNPSRKFRSNQFRFFAAKFSLKVRF
jgi:hypothetical protein